MELTREAQRALERNLPLGTQVDYYFGDGDGERQRLRYFYKARWWRVDLPVAFKHLKTADELGKALGHAMQDVMERYPDGCMVRAVGLAETASGAVAIEKEERAVPPEPAAGMVPDVLDGIEPIAPKDLFTVQGEHEADLAAVPETEVKPVPKGRKKA